MDGVEVIEGLRGWTEAPMLVLSALVDRRGRGGDQRGVLTEVVPAYRVGAASVRIGVAGLGDRRRPRSPAGGRRPPPPPGEVEQRQPAEPEDDQDLLGRVGDRRQRSEQNTGIASRFGSSVSEIRSLRSGSPGALETAAVGVDTHPF
jgi:hypothetical protein